MSGMTNFHAFLPVGGPAPDTTVNYVVGRTSAANPWQTSIDGTVWVASAQTGDVKAIGYYEALQRWIAVGDNIWISDDPLAVSWSDVTPVGWSAGEAYLDIDQATGNMVAATAGGIIASSQDGGSTWAIHNPPSDSWGGVAWDPVFELFCLPTSTTAAPDEPWSTPDGISFTQEVITGPMGAFSAASDGAGEVVVCNVNGVSAGMWSTSDGQTYSNLGNSLVTGPLSIGYNSASAAPWAIIGTSGGQNQFSRSATAAGGSWTNTALGASGTVGVNRQVVADPTRGRWVVCTRNRIFISDQALGTSFTTALSGTLFNSVGVRPA